MEEAASRSSSRTQLDFSQWKCMTGSCLTQFQCAPKIARFLHCDCEFSPQAGNRCDFRHLQTNKHYDLKVRISIASDCDFILRIPSENHVLSAEFPCDLTPAKENRCDCDFGALRSCQFQCVQRMSAPDRDRISCDCCRDR